MVVLGSGPQLMVPPTGMIPKQETVSILLNLYAKISKGLMVLIVPSGNSGIDRERKCILVAETAHSFCTYVTLPHVLQWVRMGTARLALLPAVWTSAGLSMYSFHKWGSLG